MLARQYQYSSLVGLIQRKQAKSFVRSQGLYHPQVRALKEHLIEDALKLNQASNSDCLVMRKKSNAKSVKDKYLEGVWVFIKMIQRHENLWNLDNLEEWQVE